MKWILSIVCVLCCAACKAADDAPKTTAVPAPTAVTELMRKEFPKETGSEGRMLIVEYAPGGASKPHSHPGAIFAYVLEGSVVSGLDKEAEKTFKIGESWYESPGCLHRVSRNASATEKARLLVFFVTQPGKPAVEPAKE